MHLLESGAFIAFNHIRNKCFQPITLKNDGIPPDLLVINICLNGRCELSLPKDNFVSISSKRLVFSSQLPIQNLHFPDAHYDGITLYINTTIMNATTKSFSTLSGLDFTKFANKFDYVNAPYYQFSNYWIDTLSNRLWSIQKKESIGILRLLSASLVHELMTLPQKSSPNIVLNNAQIASVEACQELLCKDLSRRYSLQDLSNYVGINESTLKARFKNVYGMTITDYMTKKRMDLAEKLLSTTCLSIGEIANQCGFKNHSKFTVAFKKFHGETPLHYRNLSNF